ncbi:MAG: TRAP transporter small permease [Synergistaceae bacterium]|jgi:TRAP-type C4-dicarboxylate transport system permease small subunit|nr:TRAP transporter small permease [Synergistaceae bacterium]
MRRVYSFFSNLRALAIVTLSGGMVALCLVQVVLRYFTSTSIRPFAWGDELIRLTSIWVAFLAASLGVREGSHLSVEFFLNRLLPSTVIKVVKRAANLVVLVCMATIIWFGTKQTLLNMDSSLQNLNVSMGLFYAAIPVGCAYLFLDYLLILIYGHHPYAWGAAALTEPSAKSHTEKITNPTRGG